MKIFISYSSEDKNIAEKLYLALVKEGHNVFFDRRSLPASGDYNQRIRDKINNSYLLIFLISHDSVKKSYALTELKYFQSNNKNPKNKVLPVKLDNVDIDSIPSYLTAVTILELEGNVVAEIVSEVERLRKLKRKPWLFILLIFILLIGIYYTLNYILKSYIYSCPSPYVHNPNINLDDLIVKIEATEYIMGARRFGTKNRVEKMTLDNFESDKFKVTNIQYKKFINETNYTPKGQWSKNYSYGADYYPVSGITIEDAEKYCESRGKRLPSEGEWEYLCRGKKNNKYPWGNSMEKYLANVDGYCQGKTIVGSFLYRGADNELNVSGVFGNVSEWTSTREIYKGIDVVVARGRSYEKNPYETDCTTRLIFPDHKEYNDSSIGFRCVN